YLGSDVPRGAEKIRRGSFCRRRRSNSVSNDRRNPDGQVPVQDASRDRAWRLRGHADGDPRARRDPGRGTQQGPCARLHGHLRDRKHAAHDLGRRDRRDDFLSGREYFRNSVERRFQLTVCTCCMPRFSIKLRGRVAVGVLAVSAALIATLATARKADSTDLTTPSFLVATRDLQDPCFQHAVILMVPTTEPPLLAGVIINKPAKQRVRDIFPQARNLNGADEAVYMGGPVEPDQASVIFRASSAIASATKVFGDTYVATGRDAVAAVLKDSRISDLRVIL